MCYFPENTCFEAEFQKRQKKKKTKKQIVNGVHFIWGFSGCPARSSLLDTGVWRAAAGF